MEVVTVCPFRVASLLWQPRRGGWVLTVVCKATYDLAPVQSRLAANQDDPNEDDNHWNDDPARSVYSPSDLVPFKVRADVILVGNAFAPRGEPVRSILTRLVVGGIDKSIEAFGERAFGPDGAVRESRGVTKVPLRYERAAGGPDTLNPVGIRPDAQPDAYGVSPAPNLQPPGMLVQNRSDVISPIGYGPIAPTWLGRLEQLGAHVSTFSTLVVREQPVPDDIDPAYFNCAPRDQQLEELRDNERIVLENLHPQHPRLVTSLPGLHPRAFVLRPGGSPQDITMKCDTLWIDTDRAQCTLTWRAQIGLDRPHGLGRVVVAMEEPGQRLTWADVERLLVSSGQAGDAAPDSPRDEPTHQPPPADKPHRPGTVPFLRPDVAGDIPAKPATPAVSALSQMSAPRPENSAPAPRAAPTASGLPFIAPKNVAPPAGSAPPADRPPPGDAAPPWLAARKTSSASVPSPAMTSATPFAPPPAPPSAPPMAPAMAPAPPPPPPARVPQAAPSPNPSPLDSPWANPSARASSGEGMPGPTVGSMAASLSPPSPIAPTSATAMAAAGLAGAAAVAAFSSASQAAPPPPAAVANAATVGAAAASNAAAASSNWSAPSDASSSPSPAVSPRTTYSHRGPSRDVVDLIWYDPKAAPKMREHPSWKLLLDKKPEPRDLDFDDEPPPEEPPDVRERKDVFAVLTRGATTDAEGIQEAIGDAVADDGTFTPPLVLVSAELTFPFDELETLKATVTAVSPLIAGDKKLKETVDTVNELLKTPWLSSSSGVAERLTQQVKDAFAQGNRMLPPSYLDTHTERMLLEQRHYQKRTVFGEPWIRSVLIPAGSSSPMPAYLPESLTKKLPMFQRFKARIVAEAHMQQDEYENHPAALKVVALGRVVSLQRRGFMR